MTELVHAYAAGIVDGEGSIQINPSKGGHGSKKYWGLTIQVASNNRAVLEWLREQYQSGSITTWKSKLSTQGKESHNWRLYSQEAGDFLKSVQSYMHIKQEQAAVALEFLESKGPIFKRLTPEAVQIRNVLARKMRELNRRYGKGTVGPFPEGVL